MIELPRHFGKYELLQRIAVGGMAEIFKARAVGLGGFEKVLAIKRLHAKYSDDHEFVQMLVDEARIAVQLNHVNIGQIFDLDRADKHVYIAMELIDGRDLYRIIKVLRKQKKRLPIEIALFIAIEFLSGMDYAHRKLDPNGNPLDIIHRDISPQNVLVSWEGEVKLVDFGIAKAASRVTDTRTGIIKGKFYYMSPEQAYAQNLDSRTDIFAGGIVLHELLTGELVYGNEKDDLTILERVRRAEIVPPSQRRPDIPPALERIVMKACAKDRLDRYQSAHEFAGALREFLYAAYSPITKVHLSTFMRSLFGDEAKTGEYRSSFLSRVDYDVKNSGLQSQLFALAEDPTAIHEAFDPPTPIAPPPFVADDSTQVDDSANPFANLDDDETSVYMRQAPHSDLEWGPNDDTYPHGNVPRAMSPKIQEPAPPLARAHTRQRSTPELDTRRAPRPSVKPTAHARKRPQNHGPNERPNTQRKTSPIVLWLVLGSLVAVLLALAAITVLALALSDSASTPATSAAAGIEAEEVASLLISVKGPTTYNLRVNGDPPEPDGGFHNLHLGTPLTIRVTAEHFEPHVSQLTPSAAQLYTRKVTLHPRAGTLHLVTHPPGAAVKVDGKTIEQTTPAYVSGIDRSKAHQVTFTLEGHEPATKAVRWSGDDSEIMAFETTLTSLTPSEPASPIPIPPKAEPKTARKRTPARKARPRRSGPGSLSVSAKPWGRVYVDGRLVARETPLHRFKLDAGAHKVRVVFPTVGGRAKQKSVTIKNGGHRRLFFTP